VRGVCPVHGVTIRTISAPNTTVTKGDTDDPRQIAADILHNFGPTPDCYVSTPVTDKDGDLVEYTYCSKPLKGKREWRTLGPFMYLIPKQFGDKLSFVAPADAESNDAVIVDELASVIQTPISHYRLTAILTQPAANHWTCYIRHGPAWYLYDDVKIPSVALVKTGTKMVGDAVMFVQNATE
jgi:hypothetical protein